MSAPYSILIRDRHGFERSEPLPGPVTLGRQSRCDIVLPDSMVSRVHLRVDKADGQWWVEDAGSSHGTFCQDKPLKARTLWEPGMTLRIADGAYLITLQHGAAAPSEVNLQAILRTANLLAGEVELDTLLEQTLDRLLTFSGTDRGFLMLPENGALQIKVRRNLGPDLEQSIQLSMSSVHRVFDGGEAIWIHNATDDDQLKSQQSIVDLKLKTILCLPLMVQGGCIGVLYLDSRRITTKPVDRPTFEAIVSLCAIAIERARLSEENLKNHVLATVGQVASSIVHDFKNALFVVRGHAEMLKEGSAGDAEVTGRAIKILEAVDRLSQLSADVLDYAKVREPNREEVDLAIYIPTTVEPHRSRAQEAGVRILCEGQSLGITLDRHRFVRVLENLLANALDALSPVAARGGECLITVRWAPVAEGARITIEDNGIGIPEKILRRIFEPFYSHGKALGTGLGMATVKKIMEEHGGRVSVESEEGRGTTVTLTLPHAAGSASRQAATARFGLPDAEERP